MLSPLPVLRRTGKIMKNESAVNNNYNNEAELRPVESKSHAETPLGQVINVAGNHEEEAIPSGSSGRPPRLLTRRLGEPEHTTEPSPLLYIVGTEDSSSA